MKVQDLIEELEEKECYKIFKTQNKEAYFAAAFLMLDIEKKTEQIQLDYYIPKQNQIAAFCFPFVEPKIHSDIISNTKKGKSKPIPMSKQTTKIKIDIDDLEPKCKKLIKENDSLIVPTKIIAILKDNIWNLTLMDNMLGIVRIKINAITEELLDFNKGGLMDFVSTLRK
ncbi:hypothetical protein J4226_01445 [Candidatus Pacearchaeota archaeon]|nr:hypothetical protein [Candidatus Pacearchaeota archaeon]